MKSSEGCWVLSCTTLGPCDWHTVCLWRWWLGLYSWFMSSLAPNGPKNWPAATGNSGPPMHCLYSGSRFINKGTLLSISHLNGWHWSCSTNEGQDQKSWVEIHDGDVVFWREMGRKLIYSASSSSSSLSWLWAGSVTDLGQDNIFYMKTLSNVPIFYSHQCLSAITFFLCLSCGTFITISHDNYIFSDVSRLADVACVYLVFFWPFLAGKYKNVSITICIFWQNKGTPFHMLFMHVLSLGAVGISVLKKSYFFCYYYPAELI